MMFSESRSVITSLRWMSGLRDAGLICLASSLAHTSIPSIYIACRTASKCGMRLAAVESANRHWTTSSRAGLSALRGRVEEVLGSWLTPGSES